MAIPNWALATIATASGPLACIEQDGRLYAMGPSLARIGMRDVADTIGLFADWPATPSGHDRSG